MLESIYSLYWILSLIYYMYITYLCFVIQMLVLAFWSLRLCHSGRLASYGIDTVHSLKGLVSDVYRGTLTFRYNGLDISLL